MRLFLFLTSDLTLLLRPVLFSSYITDSQSSFTSASLQQLVSFMRCSQMWKQSKTSCPAVSVCPYLCGQVECPQCESQDTASEDSEHGERQQSVPSAVVPHVRPDLHRNHTLVQTLHHLHPGSAPVSTPALFPVCPSLSVGTTDLHRSHWEPELVWVLLSTEELIRSERGSVAGLIPGKHLLKGLSTSLPH